MKNPAILIALLCCFLFVSGSISGGLYWFRCDLELVDCPAPESETPPSTGNASGPPDDVPGPPDDVPVPIYRCNDSVLAGTDTLPYNGNSQCPNEDYNIRTSFTMEARGETTEIGWREGEECWDFCNTSGGTRSLHIGRLWDIGEVKVNTRDDCPNLIDFYVKKIDGTDLTRTLNRADICGAVAAGEGVPFEVESYGVKLKVSKTS